MNAFYIDELPWHEGYCIIGNHFDEIDMPMLHTSYGYLIAYLVGMSYEHYLKFCEESLGAKVVRKKGAKYASVHFPITEEVKRFVGILNKKFEEGYDLNEVHFKQG